MRHAYSLRCSACTFLLVFRFHAKTNNLTRAKYKGISVLNAKRPNILANTEFTVKIYNSFQAQASFALEYFLTSLL